jgi:periplasmic protein TonB
MIMYSNMMKKGEYEEFNDLLFEKRNKEYGAYVIRKTYKKTLVLGLLIAIFIFIAFFGSLFYRSLKYGYLELDELENSKYYEPLDQRYIDSLTPPPKDVNLLPPPIQRKQDSENEQIVISKVVDSIILATFKEKPINTGKDSILKARKDSIVTLPPITNLTKEETDHDSAVFFIVDQMPEFPGGKPAINQYIKDNIRYPQQAVKNNISGIVFVSFCITDSGMIDKVYIARSIHPTLDMEAARVVKQMPRWNPGARHGQNVKVWYTLPINFLPQNQN